MRSKRGIGAAAATALVALALATAGQGPSPGDTHKSGSGPDVGSASPAGGELRASGSERTAPGGGSAISAREREPSSPRRTGRFCLMALGGHQNYRMREGGPVDLVIVSPSDGASLVLRRARHDHPRSKIFAYLNTMDVMLSRSGESASFWKKHEEWFLHDSNGDRVRVRVKNYQGSNARFGMNVAHPGYQNWLGEQAVSLLETGYDGIQLDNVETSWSYRLRHVGSFVSALPVEIDEEAWYAGEASMLRRIREMASEAGFADREIIFNHMRAGEPERSMEYLAAVDGANAEAWLNRKVDAQGAWGWRSRVDLARRAASTGKRTNLLCDRSILSREEALLAFASYLMAYVGEGSTFWYGRPYRVDDMPWFDFYDVDLGAPVGEMHAIPGGGVFRRDFEKGAVLVNPGEGEERIDLGAAFWNDSFDEVTTITLGPKEGAVLIKPEGAPPPRVDIEAEACLGAGDASGAGSAPGGGAKRPGLSRAGLSRAEEREFSGGVGVTFTNTVDECAIPTEIAPGRYRVLVVGKGAGRSADAAIVRIGREERRVAFGFSSRQIFEVDVKSRLERIVLRGAERGVSVDRIVLIRIGGAR